MVALIAALALLAGRRRLTKAYRLVLDANPGVARRPTTLYQQSPLKQQSASVMTS